MLVAVTVYLCTPVVEVSSDPVPAAPLVSVHELIPGPAASEQLKPVVTDWFWS